jgi:hypothetical protein
LDLKVRALEVRGEREEEEEEGAEEEDKGGGEADRLDLGLRSGAAEDESDVAACFFRYTAACRNDEHNRLASAVARPRAESKRDSMGRWRMRAMREITANQENSARFFHGAVG